MKENHKELLKKEFLKTLNNTIHIAKEFYSDLENLKIAYDIHYSDIRDIYNYITIKNIEDSLSKFVLDDSIKNALEEGGYDFKNIYNATAHLEYIAKILDDIMKYFKKFVIYIQNNPINFEKYGDLLLKSKGIVKYNYFDFEGLSRLRDIVQEFSLLLNSMYFLHHEFKFKSLLRVQYAKQELNEIKESINKIKPLENTDFKWLYKKIKDFADYMNKFIENENYSLFEIFAFDQDNQEKVEKVKNTLIELANIEERLNKALELEKYKEIGLTKAIIYAIGFIRNTHTFISKLTADKFHPIEGLIVRLKTVLKEVPLTQSEKTLIENLIQDLEQDKNYYTKQGYRRLQDYINKAKNNFEVDFNLIDNFDFETLTNLDYVFEKALQAKHLIEEFKSILKSNEIIDYKWFYEKYYDSYAQDEDTGEEYTIKGYCNDIIEIEGAVRKYGFEVDFHLYISKWENWTWIKEYEKELTIIPIKNLYLPRIPYLELNTLSYYLQISEVQKKSYTLLPEL